MDYAHLGNSNQQYTDAVWCRAVSENVDIEILSKVPVTSQPLAALQRWELTASHVPKLLGISMLLVLIAVYVQGVPEIIAQSLPCN